MDTSTQTSTGDSDQNGSSQDLESSTHHPGADETPLNLETAIAAEASPTDPHSVPLPQLDDSELDLLNVEEEDIYEESSSTAVHSELEVMDGLSSDDDTSDDESQAWSLVGDEEMGEDHVSAENEAEVNEEAEDISSSPLDTTHEAHIELPLVTPEDVDASAASQSLPVGGIDQISAGVNSTSNVSEPLGSEVENSHHGHEAGLTLQTPPVVEDDKSQQEISPTFDDLSTYVNVSEPETSGDVQDAKESHDSTTFIGSVDTDQSSPPDSSPDTPQTVHVVSTPEPSAPPIESATPKDDQANTASATDETPPAGLSNAEKDTPEVTHHSDTASEEPAENAVNDPPEEQPNLNLVTNETPAMHPEETHSHTEQPPPLSNPSEVSGELPTDETAISVQPVAEELDPITFEDSSSAPTNSSQNDDILVAHVVNSPVVVSVDFDISPSASPSSSTRSVFSDSPFPNRPFTEFHLVSPVSPVLQLDKQSVLFFCEGK